jgi:prephenate dehydrogenase
MKTDFPNITILGGGLLGGSLVLALANLAEPPHVRLWARQQETVDAALQLGISHATTVLATAVKDADLIVLAVPVGAMAGLVSAVLACGLPTHCLITDVGSVKRVPHLTISPLLAGSDVHFIGSHPMAGSERNGLAAALTRFWGEIGCRTSWMTATHHDQLVARISHMPHLLAASAARVCLKDPADGKYGGGGLRDTTRVAAGNPEMWAEIVMENRDALTGLLRESIADLREILASLEAADQEQALRWLVTAKHRRDPLNQLL